MISVVLTFLFVLPSLNGRITLINVGNLTNGVAEMSNNKSSADNNTIVVGVLLPRNVQGNNDVVAKESVNCTNNSTCIYFSEHTTIIVFLGCFSAQKELLGAQMSVRK